MTTPFRRRPDGSSPAHERARAAAAARLDGPIDPVAAAWLDGHLASCADCNAVAEAYDAQRRELRAMREHLPEPPRDLWARTAAAIEREAARSAVGRRASRGHPAPRRARRAAAPLGALSGLLVVAVVLAATVLSQRPLPSIGPTASPSTNVAVQPTTPSFPGATPFSVAAGNVGWLRVGPLGHVDVYDSEVERVCPGRNGAECPPIDEPKPNSITLPDPPSSVVQSPTDKQLVVADSNTKGTGGEVYVVADPDASVAPSSGPAVAASVAPSPSPSTVQPTPTPASSPSPTPVDSPTPTTAPTPSVSAEATLPVTGSPSPSPSDTVTPSASPSEAPVQPSAGTRAIASNVIVVGEAAAYSPSGAWFAFSARPADGSQGPDIYIWHVGDESAKPITTDHRSVFATWLGERVLASRGVPDPTEPAGSRTLRPQAFLLDPASGEETALVGGEVWRPSVDPQRRLAVYWDGTLTLNDASTELMPAAGKLVLGPWDNTVAAAAPGPAIATPDASESADASGSADPTASPSLPTASPPAGPQMARTELASGQVTDWDARWDETGTHLAVWIADPADPKIGKLTLYVVDPETGVLRSDRPVHDVRAQAGFSIGKGRLAWATPRGQDARGSRIQVVAWTKDSVGSVETQQSEDDVVVIR